MLQAAYTTPEAVARDTQALPNLVSVVIPVETFILFTTMTLREEEMGTNTPFHLHPTYGLLAFLSLTNGTLATILALPSLLIEQRAMNPRRPHDPPNQLTLYQVSHQPATILNPLSLPISEKQAVA
jgi:hypothetical protein